MIANEIAFYMKLTVRFRSPKTRKDLDFPADAMPRLTQRSKCAKLVPTDMNWFSISEERPLPAEELEERAKSVTSPSNGR